MTELLLIFFGAAYVNDLALAGLIDRPRKIAAPGGWGMLFVAGLLLVFAVLLQVFPQALALSHRAGLYLDLLAFVSTVFVLSNSGQSASTLAVALRRFRTWLPLLVGNVAVLAFVALDGAGTSAMKNSIAACVGASAAAGLGMALLPPLRERIEFADLPQALRGTPITLVTAALVSLAVMGALPW
jgi:electron transport complex protein RnfA